MVRRVKGLGLAGELMSTSDELKVVLARLAEDPSDPLQGYPDLRSDYGRTPPPSHVTKTAERISWSAYTAGVGGVSLRLKSRQELSLES